MQSEKIPVIAIVGPTASGKTGLSIEIAKAFDGEIVSADSMQIYKELSIATAKPDFSEMQGIVHHLIDVKSVTEDYSVAEYVDTAKQIILDIHQRNKLPIIVGGTGLYVDSLLNGYDFSVQLSDENLRKSLNDDYDRIGAENLWQRLCDVDESAARDIHYNNRKRLVRALELFELTGKTQDERNAESKNNPSIFNPLYICLNAKDRQFLYERANNRVDEMIEMGLIDEVRRYYEIDNPITASQAIGCKELKPFIDGVDDLNNCIERLKQATRRYIKRQLTWFLRNDKNNVLYIDECEKDELVLKAKGIISDFINSTKGE